MRAMIAALLVMLSAPPAAASGLIDNVNGIASDGYGGIVRFTGLVIGADGRVERRLSQGDKPPKQLDWRYDGKGRTLVPGFVDPHVDLLRYALARLGLDLADAAGPAEGLGRVAAYATANPDRRWIQAHGLTGPGPSLAELDGAVPDRPLWIVSADGTTGWANSAARKRAGVAGNAPAALAGEAMARMTAAVPQPAPKDLDAAFARAQSTLLARGITAIGDVGTRIEAWQAYRRAGDRGALGLRIVAYADGIDQMTLIAGPQPTPWLYGGRLRLAGVAFDVEGMAGTALRNRMSRAAMDGFGVTLSGRASPALAEAANAIEEVRPGYSKVENWRIDALGGTPLPQTPPGVHRLASTLPAAALIGGSPFAPLQPLAVLGAVSDGQAAFTALTAGGAAALGAAEQWGRLAPGQQADFLLVDGAMELSRPSDIGALHIRSIWIGGREVDAKG